MKSITLSFIIIFSSVCIFPQESIGNNNSLEISKQRIEVKPQENEKIQENDREGSKAEEVPLKDINKQAKKVQKGKEENKDRKYYLGLSASMFSLYGLSFQYRFLPKQRIKTTGLFYFSGATSAKRSGTDEFFMVLGLEWQYDLKKTEKTRLYSLIASGILYNESYSEISKIITIGSAIGMEIRFWKHLAVNFDFGLVFSKNTSPDTDEKRLGLGFATGLSYNF